MMTRLVRLSLLVLVHFVVVFVHFLVFLPALLWMWPMSAP